MQNTIIAVYDRFEQAQQAADELIGSGFARSEVQLNPYADHTGVPRASSVTEQSEEYERPRGSALGDFLRGLLHLDEHRAHADMYQEAVRRGASILTINAHSTAQRDQAVAILQKHRPVDMDQRVADWRQNGWEGYDEHVPLTPAPGVTEQAYAARQADASARAGADAVAAARPEGDGRFGSVRVYPGTNVDAAQPALRAVPPGSDIADTLASYDDEDFRQHWSNVYGRSGDRYEEYDAAYRYGTSVAASYRFRNYRWEEAEAEMQREWEARHPERAWGSVREAVRFGAEKRMGRDAG